MMIKYYVYALGVVLVLSGMYFGVNSYNDAIREASIQATRAEAAEAANEKLLKDQTNLNTVLEKRQSTINDLTQRRNKEDANWRKTFQKLRAENDQCVDTNLPASILSGLQQNDAKDGDKR